MKKFLLAALSFLLLASSAYAGEIKGLLFIDKPFQYESWTWASNGVWHVDKGATVGVRTVIPIFEGHTLYVSDGVIFDSTPEGKMTKDSLGAGPVGNVLDLKLKVHPEGDDEDSGSITFEYTLKNWWVNDSSYGYEYMISPNAVVQNLRVTIEWRMF